MNEAFITETNNPQFKSKLRKNWILPTCKFSEAFKVVDIKIGTQLSQVGWLSNQDAPFITDCHTQFTKRFISERMDAHCSLPGNSYNWIGSNTGRHKEDRITPTLQATDTDLGNARIGRRDVKKNRFYNYDSKSPQKVIQKIFRTHGKPRPHLMREKGRNSPKTLYGRLSNPLRTEQSYFQIKLYMYF